MQSIAGCKYLQPQQNTTSSKFSHFALTPSYTPQKTSLFFLLFPWPRPILVKRRFKPHPTSGGHVPGAQAQLAQLVFLQRRFWAFPKQLEVELGKIQPWRRSLLGWLWFVCLSACLSACCISKENCNVDYGIPWPMKFDEILLALNLSSWTMLMNMVASKYGNQRYWILLARSQRELTDLSEKTFRSEWPVWRVRQMIASVQKQGRGASGASNSLSVLHAVHIIDRLAWVKIHGGSRDLHSTLKHEKNNSTW